MNEMIENKVSAAGLSGLLPLNAPARVLITLELSTGVGCMDTVVSPLTGVTLQSRSMPKPD